MRLFIAISFPDEFKKALLDTCAALKTAGVSGNYTKRENLHLTLAFLGEVKPPEHKKVKDAMAAVDIPAIKIEAGNPGRFGDLLWAGLSADKSLNGYVASLRSELKVRDIWYDGKPFKPHVTLVRRAQNYKDVHIDMPRGSFTVEKVSLMKSERINGRLVYTEIYHVNRRKVD